MVRRDDSQSHRLAEIALWGLLFLVSLQLISDFVEAIYVFGLLGTSIPVEIASVLLFLAPLVLLLFRKGLSGWPLVAVGGLMLICRVAEPLLDPRGKMLVSGVGVACFLILLPSLLRQMGDRDGEPAGLTLGIGLTVALSLSVLFRSTGSGSDISTTGWSQVVGWALAVATGVLLPMVRRPARQAELHTAAAGETALPLGRTMGLCLGLIGVLVLCYFAFASPTVIARWTGVSYLAIVSVLAAILILSALLLALRPGLLAGLSPAAVLVWNGLFALCLVLTIAAHQVRFPADPGAYPLAPNPASHWLFSLPVFLTLALFPVLLVDAILLAQALIAGRPAPRALGAGFSLAGLYLLLIVFAQVFTTVYDYIPVAGPFFRDRFWLVFLIASLVAALPVLWVGRRAFRPLRAAHSLQPGWAVPALVALVGVGAAAAVLLTAARPAPVPLSGTSLKILTYNIQQGYSRDGWKNYEGQLDVIRQVDADIVGLQECDTTRIANGNSDVVRYMADKLDLYSYFGPSTVAGTFGIALLSKYPIENPRTFYMYSEGEQTATIWAQITAGGQTFHVYVTHLGNSGPLVQQEAILKEVEGKENVILMGDFNFRPDTEQYRLTTARLPDSWKVRWPEATESQGVAFSRMIDHIFVSPGMRVTDSTYLPGPASDHPAMTTTIAW